MTARKSSLPGRLAEVEDQFVGLWRQMSGLWGISPTMAQIHGLLFITGEALSADAIIERLGISRGNASMNLRQLIEWGLVRQVHKRGDRREYYESPSDVWEMFTTIAAQRKRREIDPVLSTLRRCHEQLSPEALGDQGEEAVQQRRRRVGELLSIVSLIDSLAQRFFESQRGLRTAVDLLAQKDD
jgi:HTH-type transcriptional regulator, glycine betaine synthesis regulator